MWTGIKFVRTAISGLKSLKLFNCCDDISITRISLSFISMKNFKFRHIVDSTPSLIIKDGKINFKEMERQRYSIDDLLTQIRDKGIKSLDEIEYAVLENNGNLSTFLYDNKKIYFFRTISKK